MNIRTDLAAELRELHHDIQGISSTEQQVGRLTISHIAIRTPEAAQKIGKPCGEYATITAPPFCQDVTQADEEVQAVADELSRFLPESDGLVLVLCLGNPQITPDALGPKVAEQLLATRHITGKTAEAVGLHGLRSVAVLAPGVLGQTGMEVWEITKALVQETKPACVIVVDALAARSMDRLGCTIQISNTGISPGSGVDNARQELSSQTLGVPVLSVGVPTVVDAATLIADLSHACVQPSQKAQTLMVTPREIDLTIGRASKIVSLAINRALQPALSLEDILYLTA